MSTTKFVDASATVQGTLVQAAWLNDADTATYDYLSAVVGTNTITAVGPTSLTTAYPTGVNFYFNPQNTNGGASTLNVNGLGAKNIVKFNGVPLGALDLVAGCVAAVIYDGTNFQLQNPQATLDPFLVVPVLQGGTGITTIIPIGQCRLVKGATNLQLAPYQGNKLAFPAGYATVPSTQVALAPTALTVGTLYYIYAVQTAGVVTSLEASTTGHTQDATTGIEIKTGDATRVLVGMAQPVTGPAWSDTDTIRQVLSWFNRRPIRGFLSLSGAISTTSATLVEINNTYRISFLSWAGDQVTPEATGFMACSAIGTVNTALFMTGTAFSGTLDGGCASSIPTAAFSATLACATSITAAADGSTFMGLQGATNSGTMSVGGSVTAGLRSTLFVLIQG